MSGLARRMRVLWLAVVLGVTAAAFYPGLQGPFLLDDYENILRVPSMAMSALAPSSARDAMFAWGDAYPHRGLARLTFALNYYFAGQSFDAFAFKATNLVIHLVNGVLVYVLSVLLLRRFAGGARPPSAEAGYSAMQTYLPLLVAALWLLHPIQLTSVLYVVQRMTSMAALFVFAGLVAFVLGRARLESGRRFGLVLMAGGLGGGVVLGFLCKQNAVLLPFFAFLVELFFFRREVLPRAVRRRLYGFYAVVVVLPAAVGVVGLVLGWERVAEGYLHRGFTPWERVLTESRVLFFYLGLMLYPQIRAFGLYHDDIAASTGWFEPWTTLPSVLAWVVLVVLALWGVRRRSLWSFAILWYLVGHALESTVIGLELVFEHRNYVPSFGVMFAAAFYLVWGLGRLGDGRRLAGGVALAVVVVLGFVTFTRAGVWSDRLTLIEMSLENHPRSSRTHGEYALINASRVAPIEVIFHHWQRAAELNPNSVLELIEMARILSGQILALEASEANAGAGAAAPLTDPLTASLVADVEYLRALNELVAREIRTRLATRPVTMSNVGALRALEDCARNGLAPCVALVPRAIEWASIAKGNPRIAPHARGILSLRLAKLHALDGNVEAAVANAREAASLSTDRVHFLFELASLYLTLGDLDAAERAIDEAEDKMSYSGFRWGVLRDLKAMLEQARATRGSAAATGG